MTERNTEIDTSVLDNVLMYGIPGLIRRIIIICRKKHEHYAPDISTFSVWADILERHVNEMQDEVASVFESLSNHTD